MCPRLSAPKSWDSEGKGRRPRQNRVGTARKFFHTPRADRAPGGEGGSSAHKDVFTLSFVPCSRQRTIDGRSDINDLASLGSAAFRHDHRMGARQGVTMIISVSVPLGERSETAIGLAIERALESAVRDAMTRGLDSVELVSARLADDRVDIRVQAPSVKVHEA